ncbi:MAG: cytidine deaminase [Saprospiraceae bacterium]
MADKILQIRFQHFDAVDELSIEDSKMIQEAFDACQSAYAPYSAFPVGAAILLEDDSIITGTNQENASYPCGICAERTALYTYSALRKTSRIISMAVCCAKLYPNEWPASPCGLCRQVISEFEQNNSGPIRILLGHPQGQIITFDSASTLLPFGFSSKDLSR